MLHYNIGELFLRVGTNQKWKEENTKTDIHSDYIFSTKTKIYKLIWICWFWFFAQTFINLTQTQKKNRKLIPESYSTIKFSSQINI